MNVQGALSVEGTNGAPVVFTSLGDDEYGGDTNGDATSIFPYAGSWRGINLLSASESIFDGAIVRYAGGNFGSSGAAAIKADSPLIIRNSILEKNSFRGVLLMNNSSSTILDTIFRSHQAPARDENASALTLYGPATSTLQNLIFRDNNIAIQNYGGTIIDLGGIDIDDSNHVKPISF